MSIHDLMKPRYKVIALYPECGFELGDVVMRQEEYIGWIVPGKPQYYELDVSLFPHLFKRMEWWEERKVEDMPRYLRAIHNINGEKTKQKIYKAEPGEFGNPAFTKGYEKGGDGFVFSFDNVNLENFRPATKREYHEHNQHLKITETR